MTQETLQIIQIAVPTVIPSAIFVFIGFLLEKRLTEVKKALEVNNNNFTRHLIEFHSRTLSERETWKVYFNQ